MPHGVRDWVLFSALAAWILYVFKDDMGGFVATVIYSLVVYSLYLTLNWIGRRLACYGTKTC